MLAAPELDDLLDTDNLGVLVLEFPDDPWQTGNPVAPPRGRHRREPAPAVRGRVLMAAVAAGAAAAAAHQASHLTDRPPMQAVLVAHHSPVAGKTVPTPSHGMQVVTAKQAANVVVHNEELAKGVAYAQERAEREARLQRPLFVLPTHGQFSSNFGYRWGALHAGIDIANSIGTPILAASDGIVIEAGSSAGYGMLVKVRHFDGTVTLYGHVNSTTVGVGERVMAGDQIATMGNRGYSTGPHLHFEVLVNGSTRVDPVPWLRTRGISVTGA